MLKTSIILCTYNEANYIKKTILELEKNISNLELIIIDDNSSDGTTEIRVKIFYEYLKIKPLMTQNEGFTVLKKKKNREKDFEIIFSINKENNRITFPSTTNLGFLDAC